MKREKALNITLSEDEFAKLDELKPPGMTRPAFMRSFLHEPPGDDDVATRQEALAILTRQARDGKVASAIALERALRVEGIPLDDELEKILNG